MARSRWVSDDTIGIILALLTVENRLAVEMSLRYGMRIGDVLALRRVDVEKGAFSYREEKTGKRRRVQLSDATRRELLGIAGRVFVFEHRTDWTKHRTRQAVWKDMKRAAWALRCEGTVSPHSARKAYAVHRYREGGRRSLERVQRLLNHSSEAVTMLYALADEFENGDPPRGGAGRR